MRLSFDKSLIALTVVDSFYGQGLSKTEPKSSVWFLSLDKLFASLAYIGTLENNAVQANLIRKLKSKLSNANGMGREVMGLGDASDMGGGGSGLGSGFGPTGGGLYGGGVWSSNSPDDDQMHFQSSLLGLSGSISA